MNSLYHNLIALFTFLGVIAQVFEPITEFFNNHNNPEVIAEAIVLAAQNLNQETLSLDLEPQNTGNNLKLLIESIRQNNIKVVELLIDQGVNVNGKTEDGDTPLSTAVQNQAYEIVRLLIKNGAVN